MVSQEPIVRVIVEPDGQDFTPILLSPSRQNKFHYRLDGKVKRAGNIHFHYGWLGNRLEKVGNIRINYGWFGNVTLSGTDPRVEVVVTARDNTTRNNRCDFDDEQ
ncbi:MAG: hypothetical protein AAFV98_11675 [Chloroflexota bacterium]